MGLPVKALPCPRQGNRIEECLAGIKWPFPGTDLVCINLLILYQMRILNAYEIKWLHDAATTMLAIMALREALLGGDDRAMAVENAAPGGA